MGKLKKRLFMLIVILALGIIFFPLFLPKAEQAVPVKALPPAPVVKHSEGA